MSSPRGKRRPASISGYEPLLQKYSGEKPKPPPKPKPLASLTDSKQTGGGGYFETGGSTGNIGYCLSSVYKTKKTSSSEHTEGDDEGSDKKSPVIGRPKFAPGKDASRPPLASLPAKFRTSFEERSKQSKPGSVHSEPVTGVLVAIAETNGNAKVEVARRPPPPRPTVASKRMSNPLPDTASMQLQRNLEKSNSFKTSSLKMSSFERKSFSGVPSGTPPASPTPTTRRVSSPITTTRSISSPTSSIHSTASPTSSLRSSTPSTPPASVNKSIRPITYAQPPPRELEYVEREHPKKAFQYLEKFRQKGELCDATLLVGDKEIKAHRVVLASCSEYFESMFIGEFAEPLNEPVIIDEVSDDTLETLVDFAYTSHITLTEKNVYSIFEAADLLQFTGVRGACFKFFKQQINKSNCIRTWLFAKSHNCTELIDASLRYIECNFLEIVKGTEFLELDQPDIVVEIVGQEDLAITSEEQVYEGVLSWIKNKLELRKKHVLEVFRSVRFSSMSKDYLMHIVDNEDLIKDDPDLLQLLIAALESHVTLLRGTLKKKAKTKKKHLSMDLSLMKPRAASMAIEVVEVCRQNYGLGLRLMGGKDRPWQVFRQGDKPGVFILKVLEGSGAARSERLKPGDRILKVDNHDMTSITHEEAIHVLKNSSDPIAFTVRHEGAPPGLQEITMVTKAGEGFGLAIAGGVNSYSGNPLDETDEGIFISQIIPGGAAELDGRLKVGTRILQVNSVSVFGKTNEEVLKMLQTVLDRLNMLICDGYDPETVSKTPYFNEST